MSEEYVVKFRLEDRQEPSVVVVRTVDAEGNITRMDQEVSGGLRVVGSTTVVAWTRDDLGYWAVAQQIEGDSEIVFPRILPPGRFGWWHVLHGVANDRSTGSQIRIGVIDEALSVQGESSCIRHINNLADQAWSSGPKGRAVQPMTYHSHAVCSLLTSRPFDGVGVAGVAPGADVYFAAAGEDDSPSLDPTRLANSIDMLVEEYECHLITVSAGDSKQPTDEIRFSVQAARKRGCLCLFAAGNQGGEPFYPARYSEVLAVGACGRSGTTPEGSYLNVYEQMPGILGEDGLFLWRDSAYGEHVELLAAGVGTLWCINGRVAFAACGTSYASPVATGVLAVLLSSNEEYLGLGPTSKRTEMALYSLRASCLPLGLTGAAVYGLPVALQEA